MSEPDPVRAWLSLGSNITPHVQIASAIEALSARFGELTVSTIYENMAVGFNGENFLNLVVGIKTQLSPQALVEVLHEIEMSHGRVRGGEKFSSRTLDIDLLTYGDQIIDQGSLQVPRDEILRYAFVLLPLSEVAGNERHPQTGQTYRDLWESFDDSDQPLWPVTPASGDSSS
ncbi:MAG: 2-amino-4-hydroxy-6-hydroxymethyldihydropteridine diphosphokinase [Candidatus Thiodiazotropha sp. (ex Gloverina cf. vestifex)]|nr:2-amino-4-hydroxy-6-hydroxymethyldihydropteridine diphosphokinase [Candidatus Thiodiazotropha sp. (ex Gloverina cf. vestifex)]